MGWPLALARPVWRMPRDRWVSWPPRPLSPAFSPVLLIMVTSMAYVYPHDLPKHIEDAWQSYPGIPKERRRPLGLPLAPLLEPAYHASFLREEGRQVRFRIAYLTEAQAQTFMKPGFRSLPFIASRPYTADELRRLAPATDFTQSLVAVAPPSLVSEEPPVIWGLVSIGSAFRNFSRRQRASVTLPPDFLEVTSLSPGRLFVRDRESCSLCFRGANSSIHEP
jgi:hypothetical protein